MKGRNQLEYVIFGKEWSSLKNREGQPGLDDNQSLIDWINLVK